MPLLSMSTPLGIFLDFMSPLYIKISSWVLDFSLQHFKNIYKYCHTLELFCVHLIPLVVTNTWYDFKNKNEITSISHLPAIFLISVHLSEEYYWGSEPHWSVASARSSVDSAVIQFRFPLIILIIVSLPYLLSLRLYWKIVPGSLRMI